jgi:hypothetical protein
VAYGVRWKPMTGMVPRRRRDPRRTGHFESIQNDAGGGPADLAEARQLRCTRISWFDCDGAIPISTLTTGEPFPGA